MMKKAKIYHKRGQRNGSAIKNTCSYRKLSFDSQHPHGSWEPMPPSDFMGTGHARGNLHLHRQTLNTYKQKYSVQQEAEISEVEVSLVYITNSIPVQPRPHSDTLTKGEKRRGKNSTIVWEFLFSNEASNEKLED